MNSSCSRWTRCSSGFCCCRPSRAGGYSQGRCRRCRRWFRLLCGRDRWWTADCRSGDGHRLCGGRLLVQGQSLRRRGVRSVHRRPVQSALVVRLGELDARARRPPQTESPADEPAGRPDGGQRAAQRRRPEPVLGHQTAAGVRQPAQHQHQRQLHQTRSRPRHYSWILVTPESRWEVLYLIILFLYINRSQESYSIYP